MLPSPLMVNRRTAKKMKRKRKMRPTKRSIRRHRANIPAKFKTMGATAIVNDRATEEAAVVVSTEIDETSIKNIKSWWEKQNIYPINVVVASK